MAERVTFVLEVVSIREVEADREGTTVRYLTGREREEIGGRRAQTLAGYVALKKALLRLLGPSGGRELDPRDFLLTHRESGAPCLASFPAGAEAEPGRLLVSISHTRDWAYGLAVRKEEE